MKLLDVVEFRIPERQMFRMVFFQDFPDIPNRLIRRIRRIFFAGRIRMKRKDIRIGKASRTAESIQKIRHFSAEIACYVRSDDLNSRIDFFYLLVCSLLVWNKSVSGNIQVWFIEDFPETDFPLIAFRKCSHIAAKILNRRIPRGRFSDPPFQVSQLAFLYEPFRIRFHHQKISENSQYGVARICRLTDYPV